MCLPACLFRDFLRDPEFYFLVGGISLRADHVLSNFHLRPRVSNHHATIHSATEPPHSRTPDCSLNQKVLLWLQTPGLSLDGAWDAEYSCQDAVYHILGRRFDDIIETQKVQRRRVTQSCAGRMAEISACFKLSVISACLGSQLSFFRML